MSWLIEVAGPVEPAGSVFYAVPHAGAGVAAVRDLCRHVGQVFPAAAVRLPAREARLHEPPECDVRAIARATAEAITTHAAGRPITVYGHCSGAIVAFETVRRLRDTRADVQALVLSAHHAPDRVPRSNAWTWSSPDFVRQVARDGYLPGYIADDPELLELVLPALRADYEAIETYQPDGGASVNVPIVGLRGMSDEAIDGPEFTKWSGFTTAGFEVHDLPGGHNLLLEGADAIGEVVLAAMHGV